MSPPRRPGQDAIRAKGFLKAHLWLMARRVSQVGILAAFLLGPLAGVWLVKGTLSFSLTLGVLPLTDPFVLLQTLFAGHGAEQTALLGGALVTGFYLLVGGRAYCAFVCPMNIVTDAANWLAQRLDTGKGWQPKRETRLWLLGAALVASAVAGSAAWELVNPVSLLHRGIIFGMGLGWTVILGVFLFDFLLSRRGWCGHLCPMGAFYGVLGRASLVRVLAPSRMACADCLDCYAVCPEPHVITPALKGQSKGQGVVITSGDCTNCGRCIDVCPKSVFAFGTRFQNINQGDGT